MLKDYLNKKNTSNSYVTHKQLATVLETILQRGKLIGPKGDNASVTQEMLDKIITATKPIKGVDYFDGKDGKTPVKGVDYFDGKDGTEITPGELMSKLKQVRGDDRLLIDDIRGGKKIINRVRDLTIATNNTDKMYDGFYSEFSDFRKEIEAIEILKQPSGGSGGFGATTCQTSPPTEAGTEGDTHFDSAASIMYMYVCGTWVRFPVSKYTPVPEVEPPVTEAMIVTEDEVALLAEDGSLLVVE